MGKQTSQSKLVTTPDIIKGGGGEGGIREEIIETDHTTIVLELDAPFFHYSIVASWD